ncbi:U11/U12 small nuclear ribonucleoprotein 25 kDa protein-like [Haliotis rufescens]|uniref:U11/U12 small nuclear ribonucleoprotein 25 kDa protein-like n=1 Tax=Haliotis rufescens TaxID=6454 RepID=UPI001EB06AA1|nr:U11/U12 small nuclear ribonucleoprotein 25 kDa protein-like [Haliotis rufescens]
MCLTNKILTLPNASRQHNSAQPFLQMETTVQVKTEPLDIPEDRGQPCVDTEGEEGEIEETGVDDGLPHQEAMARVNSTIAELIESDPLLKDLPGEVTLEEVNSAIAVEYGQAMVVDVMRADGEVLKIVVVQDASVLDLKHAIRRHVTLRQSRRGGTTLISWRYIWRSYWLYFDGQKLSDDRRTLKSYGIRNRDEIMFIHKLRKT